MWNITNTTMADPTNATSIIKATGRYNNDFVKSYIRFRMLLQKDAIGIDVLAAPRAGHQEDNEKTVDYWIAASEHADEDVARVGKEACMHAISSCLRQWLSVRFRS